MFKIMQEKSSAFYTTLVFTHAEPGPTARLLQWQPWGTPNSHRHQDVPLVRPVASGTRGPGHDKPMRRRPGSLLTCTGRTPAWSCAWVTPGWGGGSLGHVWDNPPKNGQRGRQERGCWCTVWEHGL